MSQALQFLILTTAGWLNRRQEDAIDYPRAVPPRAGQPAATGGYSVGGSGCCDTTAQTHRRTPQLLPPGGRV